MEVPSGYRFLPTDLELVRDYLFRKITNHKLPSDVAIVEYDIYATEPWNLPVNNKLDAISSSRSYYFVKLFDGKMTSSIGRRQRVVNPRCYDNGVVGGGRRRGGGGGYWKKIAGGRDSRYIRDESYGAIGVKKSFAFHAYLHSPSHSINNTTAATTSDNDDDDNDGTTTITAMTTSWKTNWIMDEYSLNSKRTQPWVLCILRRKGGVEEEDDELQLLLLEQVQQQEKEVQPAHDIPHELKALELIKTIQGRIKANQIKIWDDQYKLREISRVRISTRLIKQAENMNLERARNADMVTQLREGKLKRSEVDELRQQRREAAEKEAAAAEAEAVAIRAGTYYHVPLPSRFKRIRRNNEFH